MPHASSDDVTLVTGGAGFIGSSVVRVALVEGDIQDAALVERLFSAYAPARVLHPSASQSHPAPALRRGARSEEPKPTAAP